jgi:hypothetical protein
MDEEDDDLYDPADSLPVAQARSDPNKFFASDLRPEAGDAEEVEEVDEDEVSRMNLFLLLTFPSSG